MPYILLISSLAHSSRRAHACFSFFDTPLAPVAYSKINSIPDQAHAHSRGTMKSQSNYQLPQHKPMPASQPDDILHSPLFIYSFADDGRGREQCKWIKCCQRLLLLFFFRFLALFFPSPPPALRFSFSFSFSCYFLQLNFICKNAKIQRRSTAKDKWQMKRRQHRQSCQSGRSRVVIGGGERGCQRVGWVEEIIMALISFRFISQ